MYSSQKREQMCRFKEFYPPNAAVTAKDVKIDAVVGAAVMARTKAERVQRGRRGQLIIEARIRHLLWTALK